MNRTDGKTIRVPDKAYPVEFTLRQLRYVLCSLNTEHDQHGPTTEGRDLYARLDNIVYNIAADEQTERLLSAKGIEPPSMSELYAAMVDNDPGMAFLKLHGYRMEDGAYLLKPKDAIEYARIRGNADEDKHEREKIERVMTFYDFSDEQWEHLLPDVQDKIIAAHFTKGEGVDE